MIYIQNIFDNIGNNMTYSEDKFIIKSINMKLELKKEKYLEYYLKQNDVVKQFFFC